MEGRYQRHHALPQQVKPFYGKGWNLLNLSVIISMFATNHDVTPGSLEVMFCVFC